MLGIRSVITNTVQYQEAIKRHHNFHNVKVSGGIAVAFKGEPDQIIVGEKYLPEQISNVEETNLFWKRMPERTYIQQHFRTTAAYKVNKESVALVLAGNVAGFKLKLFLIYHLENTGPLKNLNNNSLHVYYSHNKKALMIFE
ncbi:hypothetical protein M514_19553 [Trichuris suis]|uniref:Uncharacterized protein n=1 Tax=Trichuris suis TaxID=68888 RepID=A0A085NFP5_9BILA|nr:hypothetical protein M514_19553 [Trichuris suis]